MVTSLTRLECGARLHRFQLVLEEFFGLALGLEVNHCGWIYLFLTIPANESRVAPNKSPKSEKELLHFISVNAQCCNNFALRAAGPTKPLLDLRRTSGLELLEATGCTGEGLSNHVS